MQGMGQNRFEEWFLGEKSFSDDERARNCGITVEEARRLREFADRAFIQGEFETSAPAPEKVFSAVAGIEIEDDKPVLAFFHREIWKQRYRVNEERLAQYLAGMPPAEAGKVKNLVSRLEVVERRKTTLYRILEEVLRVQSEYLRTGEPERRQPLMQRSMAVTVGVDPSVINRLISNKSVQLPWGVEAPLEVFFPSAKDINRERLYALAEKHPGLTDAALASEMENIHGVRLSRRSIAQYRKELSLGVRGQRTV
jgi:RNA polymerase sigma-54 factor